MLAGRSPPPARPPPPPCWGLMFRVQGSGFRVQVLGFRVQGSGFRVQVLGFRVQGVGFRVWGAPLSAPTSSSVLHQPGQVCLGLDLIWAIKGYVIKGKGRSNRLVWAT